MFEFGSMSLLNIVIPKGAPSSLLVLEKGRTAHKRTHTHERFGGRGSREKGREVRNGKRKEPWSICKKRKRRISKERLSECSAVTRRNVCTKNCLG